jgi:hypothetical protein
MIIAMMRGDRPSSPVELLTTLVTRASTAPPMI